jgi:hypothetical protein
MGAHHRTVTGLLVSLFVAGLMTGCGPDAGTPSTGESSSAAGGSLVPPSSSPSPSPAASSGGSGSSAGSGTTGGSGPSTAAGEMTLSGQVEAGVEANCLMLRSGGQLYHLMGGDKNIVKTGNNVVVRGHIAKGVMSYCMQGQPFQVTEARQA